MFLLQTWVMPSLAGLLCATLIAMYALSTPWAFSTQVDRLLGEGLFMKALTWLPPTPSPSPFGPGETIVHPVLPNSGRADHSLLLSVLKQPL